MISKQYLSNTARAALALAASVTSFACTSAVPPPAPVTVVKGATMKAPAAITASTHPPAADASRLRADVERFAVEREPGSPGWRRTREACEERLHDLGLEVAEQRFYVDPTMEQVNVLGEKPGGDRSSEKVVLSAHYDHVAGCPGADDDASGLAAILEVARLLSHEKFPRTLVVACWDMEEDGLVGSTFYAKGARERGEDIKLAVALDAVGFTDPRPHAQRLPQGLTTLAPDLARKVEKRDFRADFIALVHDPNSAPFMGAFEKEAGAVGLELGDLEVSRLEQIVMNDVMRADHASFWLQGYPAVLLSDSGEFRNPGYHCWNAVDSPDTLDYGFLAKVTSATSAMVASALRGEEKAVDD